MKRSNLLSMLLNMDISVNEITGKLSVISWDSDIELATLTRENIFNALEKYQNNHIEKDEIEEWANIIEGREDIEREKHYECLINQVLYELENPLLTEPLTKKRARILSIKLR